MLDTYYAKVVYKAFGDPFGWKYDPCFYTFYHEQTGVFFWEDDVTKWRWKLYIVDKHKRHGRPINLSVDFANSPIVGKGVNLLRLFLPPFGWLAKINVIKYNAKRNLGVNQ